MLVITVIEMIILRGTFLKPRELTNITRFKSSVSQCHLLDIDNFIRLYTFDFVTLYYGMSGYCLIPLISDEIILLSANKVTVRK